MTRKEYNNAVDLYADGLYRFLLKNVGEEESAKDIVQDVFAKLWEKHETVQAEKVKSYLFTSGYHTMINLFNKNKRIGEFTEAVESSLSHNSQYSDLSEILDEAIKKLSDKQRTIVLLRDYEGYSYQEIGEMMNLNESQVKINIFRARKFLQQYLKSVETVL